MNFKPSSTYLVVFFRSFLKLRLSFFFLIFSTFSIPSFSEATKILIPFPVYTDHGQYEQNFIPAGWMGDFFNLYFEEDCKTNPKGGSTCMKWVYDLRAKKIHRWAGVYWQFPSNNWGDIDGGIDLTGAKSISFWARGETGEEVVEFKVGGIYGVFSDSLEISSNNIRLSKQWKKYEFVFNDEDLTHVNGGFCWVAPSDGQTLDKIVFYLDDIWVN